MNDAGWRHPLDPLGYQGHLRRRMAWNTPWNLKIFNSKLIDIISKISSNIFNCFVIVFLQSQLIVCFEIILCVTKSHIYICVDFLALCVLLIYFWPNKLRKLNNWFKTVLSWAHGWALGVQMAQLSAIESASYPQCPWHWISQTKLNHHATRAPRWNLMKTSWICFLSESTQEIAW